MKPSAQPLIRTSTRVMFYDTDAGGVVSNISYLRIVEHARTLLAESLGWKMEDCERNQCWPVVARTEIDYRRPSRLGDTLTVEGWLVDVRPSRFWSLFHVLRESDGLLIAEARQMLALVQLPSGRPVRVPSEWKRFVSPE